MFYLSVHIIFLSQKTFLLNTLSFSCKLMLLDYALRREGLFYEILLSRNIFIRMNRLNVYFFITWVFLLPTYLKEAYPRLCASVLSLLTYPPHTHILKYSDLGRPQFMSITVARLVSVTAKNVSLTSVVWSLQIAQRLHADFILPAPYPWPPSTFGCGITKVQNRVWPHGKGGCYK